MNRGVKIIHLDEYHVFKKNTRLPQSLTKKYSLFAALKLKRAIHNEITISVETTYVPSVSSPETGKFIFAYRIHIENESDYKVQLLSRAWHIIDSSLKSRFVEGEGVVGLQPELEPGQSHVYESFCELQSPFGKMYGHYIFQRLPDNKKFAVQIPVFFLEYPMLLN